MFSDTLLRGAVVFLNYFILKLFDAGVVKGLCWGCIAGVIHQRVEWHRHGDNHNNEQKDALIQHKWCVMTLNNYKRSKVKWNLSLDGYISTGNDGRIGVTSRGNLHYFQCSLPVVGYAVTLCCVIPPFVECLGWWQLGVCARASAIIHVCLCVELSVWFPAVNMLCRIPAAFDLPAANILLMLRAGRNRKPLHLLHKHNTTCNCCWRSWSISSFYFLNFQQILHKNNNLWLFSPRFYVLKFDIFECWHAKRS